ncbi:MAG: glycosyltransferase [Chromatiaceae bacterium]|nr:glycosyltransferase [Chromatiaceae bacterium]MCF8002610.1 glycosyltransferase [Chromatiaceae bacterium]
MPAFTSIRASLRYVPRLLHILRTEGIRVSVAKIRRRLKTTPLRPGPSPRLLQVTPPYPALDFTPTDVPRASVIIPVHNQYRHTYHCLASLRQHHARLPWELIVVDDDSTDETGIELSKMKGIKLVKNADNLGFVGSCNRGAACADGDILVFLNNDTQVQPGWLDALVETFDAHPHAGIVGSRLLYPDGRLQEAGAIAFADGSAWNYGHLDHPDKPEYSYLRQPDYVSGAALAVRRELFLNLGGFDEAFSPGYYEDADLAFRVRAAGYQVYYQPRALVVHYEGVTSGTNENAGDGMKRFQKINQQVFLDRWGEVLARNGSRGDSLDAQKDRHIRGRVLVVDIYMLTPDRESGSLRMINLIQILQALGYQVTFASLTLEAPQPYVNDLQQLGVEVLYKPYIRSPEHHLKQFGERYSLVLLSRADSAARLLEVARRYSQNARIIFDTVDLHFLREQRMAHLTGDAATSTLAKHRRKMELDLIQRADTTLVVSYAEQALLAQQLPHADVRLLSNVHQIHGSRKIFAQRRDLLFIGGFGHPPNVDAVLWFCQKIHTRLLASIPDLIFNVIGGDPPESIRALESDSVRIHGHVRDAAPYFDNCRLSVAPLRFGAGVKGKINQSLAYGLPVVATTMACEGMHLIDGVSALIADDPDHFAAAIIRTYNDEELWQRLSSGGLAVMVKHFSFQAAQETMQGLFVHPAAESADYSEFK